MYTQCPECLTAFKLRAAELAGARGTVFCPHCHALFDALQRLIDELPPEPFEQLPTRVPAATPPELELPVFRPHVAAQAEEPPVLAARDATRAFVPAPTFAHARRRPPRPARNGRWWAASFVLAIALLLQVGWAERTHWLDDARVRPWADRACAKLGCRLPLRRDLAALVLVSRDIRRHPSVADALVVSASLRNTATFAQAYPVIAITLSDLDENRIAMRRFNPREYLGDPAEIETGLAAGATTNITLEIVDPGRNAVAFEFNFE
jgi:predicted Zn finger-like uncharacterized protein